MTELSYNATELNRDRYNVDGLVIKTPFWINDIVEYCTIKREARTCLTCNGTKIIVGNNEEFLPCPRCNGKGYIAANYVIRHIGKIIDVHLYANLTGQKCITEYLIQPGQEKDNKFILYSHLKPQWIQKEEWSMWNDEKHYLCDNQNRYHGINIGPIRNDLEEVSI